jgi:hypothetical protein
MKALMNLNTLKNTQELQTFLDGSEAVAFSLPKDKSSRYKFVQSILKQFHYRALKKSQKGVVITFLIQVTGYSHPQLMRLVRQYRESGVVRLRKPSAPTGFRHRYTTQDITLLAQMDERYHTPSGALIKKYCERAYRLFSQNEYENIAQISVSHLYNLRDSKSYKNQRRTFKKTQSRQVSIGERRKPLPHGEPGYIRVDTVHQGDQDGAKGVYHINAVDEVTQYEVVLSSSKISEVYLIPILTEMLDTFPFKLKGFHAEREACPWGTMAQNTLINTLPNCSISSILNSLNLVQGRAMIMPWQKVKMPRLFVKHLATVILIRAGLLS